MKIQGFIIMEFSHQGFIYLLIGYLWVKAANRHTTPPIIFYSFIYLGILNYFIGVKKFFINKNGYLIDYEPYTTLIFFAIASMLTILIVISLFFDFSKKNRNKLEAAQKPSFNKLKECILNTWDVWALVMIIISALCLSLIFNLL